MPRPIPELERRHRLECLRLASELVQLAKGSLAPALREQIVRMAKGWTDQAEADLAASGTKMRPPFD